MQYDKSNYQQKGQMMNKQTDTNQWPDKLGPGIRVGNKTIRLAAKNGQWWIPAVEFVPLTGFKDPYKTVQRNCSKEDMMKLVMFNARGARRELCMINLKGAISIARVAPLHLAANQLWLVWDLLPSLADPAPVPKVDADNRQKSFLHKLLTGSKRSQAS